MRIDLTLSVDTNLLNEFTENERMIRLGHLGTHFDGMNREFSLDYWKLRGKVIKALDIVERDIELKDIETSAIQEDDFIVFYTGFLGKTKYGSEAYFTEHPQLSMELINFLLTKKIKMIGIDGAGLRRGGEHTPTDQHCADNDVFVVENIANLDLLYRKVKNNPFRIYTAPVNFSGMSGLPCRVIAEF
jgi:kynurenine formamidase